MGIESTFTRLSPDNSVYVPMNAAKHTRIAQDGIGQIYTTALASCTGIAGLARTDGDTLAGVAHFDAQVDASQRKGGHSASELFIRDFTKLARFMGSGAVYFNVAYWPGHVDDDAYGVRGADSSTWHFLDQLEEAAAHTDTDVTIQMQPYEDIVVGHTLAVSVDLDAQAKVEFL